MSGPSERDEIAAELAKVARAHHFGQPNGGTATGSTCECTCGEMNFINSARDMALSKAFRHLADMQADALTDLLAERDRRTAATAVGEAADELDRRWYEREAEMPDSHEMHYWLDGHEAAEQAIRDRADRIERGE